MIILPKKDVKEIALPMDSILKKKSQLSLALICHYLLLTVKWVSSPCQPQRHFADRE